jgi:hypothetical protein
MRPLISGGVSRRFVDAFVDSEAPFSRRFTVSSGQPIAGRAPTDRQRHGDLDLDR